MTGVQMLLLLSLLLQLLSYYRYSDVLTYQITLLHCQVTMMFYLSTKYNCNKKNIIFPLSYLV